jgi:hypothetical protein
MTPQEFAKLMHSNQQLGIGPHGDQAHDLLQPARTAPPAAYIMTSNKVPTEHEEQVALFQWAEGSGIPELELMTAIPNGGYRHPATAALLKAEGVQAGYPDILIDVARGGYHGYRLELKRSDHSNHPTPEQKAWIERLRAQGYRVDVCYGCEEAIDAILMYLGMYA